MIVKEAKALARQWVIAEVDSVSDLHGAYFAGSTTWLPDSADLPATSDVDINLVLTDPNQVDKRGKFIYEGVLLEVTYLSADQVRTPDQVLAHYHLAGGLRDNSIILDPSGQLTELQAAVARGFARRPWVRRRCEHARDNVLNGIRRLDETVPFPDQAIGWLFPTGVTTHVLLVAGLKNPTVRQRYTAVRELLADYGRLDFHETLLGLLGCANLSRPQVEYHLAALEDVFDAATSVIRTPVPFASDISDIARAVAIDGSRVQIERGYHREAVFWIAVTYSRCQKVLHQDAPDELRDRFDAGHRELLANLGISSFTDLQERGNHVVAILPQVWELAAEIIAANPDIAD
jgi:hypothetical protein